MSYETDKLTQTITMSSQYLNYLSSKAILNQICSLKDCMTLANELMSTNYGTFAN